MRISIPHLRVRRTVAVLSAAYGFVALLGAQNALAQTGPQWRRVAGTTLNAGLASPATGPVTAVWYAAGFRSLLVQTESGRVFETPDFVHWNLNATVTTPPLRLAPANVSAPEPGAKVQAAGTRLYAIGQSNLYSSDDNGATWLNLTGFNGRSILGGGFTSVAISPSNPQDVTAANQAGLWRSLDGGLSWRGINEDLPNLPVRKLVDRRTVILADGTVAELVAGSWAPKPEGAPSDPELALRARFSGVLGVDITAAASSGGFVYAAANDGRLFSSADRGATWRQAASPVPGMPAPTRIWVDGERPEVALANAGSRLLRTINAGLFWDDVTGTLPNSQIHGVAADRSAGVVYVATGRGVFSGALSLNDAGSAASAWKSISGGLPASAAWDIRLNPDNTLTVALDGYGIFETAAPHRTRNVRLVNGADLSDRAAAPGSLVTVLGTKVTRVSTAGIAYAILASSEQSTQLQVPFETATGSFVLALEAGGDRWTAPLTIKNAAPSIFVDGDGAPLILDAESGLVMDPGMALHAGSSVQVLTTGLGKVTPEWPAGVPAPLDSPPVVNGTVTAFFDGTPAAVARATLAPGYAGYYVVELQIPSIVNRGAVELRIVMNGEESNRVKLYLEPLQ